MPGQLAAKIRAKHPGVYDDLDDAALESKVLAKYPEYADLSEKPADAPAAPARTWTDTAIDALPTIGGALGGIAGGIGGAVAGLGVGGVPGAIGGAAVGGAGGEGFRQAIQTWRGKETPRTTGEALGGIGKEGAIQGAAEGVGLGVGRILTKAAVPVYNFGLGAAKRLRLENPLMARTAIDEAITVSGKGSEKAARLLGQSRQQADDLIAAAQQSGAGPVPTNTVVKGFGELSDEAGRRAIMGKVDETGDIAARARAVHRNHPGGIPLTKAQALKRTMQDEADAAFRAKDKGAIIKSVEANLDKASAQGLRQGIEDLVPGVRAVNQRTQSLGGLTKALEDAETRNSILSRLIVPTVAGVGSGFSSGDAKTGLGSAALTAGIMAPGNLSRAAIGMDRMGKYQLPVHVVRALLMARMGGDQNK